MDNTEMGDHLGIFSLSFTDFLISLKGIIQNPINNHPFLTTAWNAVTSK